MIIMPDKDTELRFVIRSEMTDDELERYVQNVAEDLEEIIKATLVERERLICYLQTDKVSYESRQAIKELGED